MSLCQGLKTQLLAGFTGPDGGMVPKVPRQLFVFYDEESYLARLDKVRGFNYNMSETVHLSLIHI